MANYPTIPPNWATQQLSFLDKTSPQFQQQLGNFFRGNFYRTIFPSLQSESLAWIVEYLDNVRIETALLRAGFDIIVTVASRRHFRSRESRIPGTLERTSKDMRH